MLELYHAGLSQASVKVRTTLKEKGLDYKSHYLRLPEGEHLTPEFLAINPDGQVPALIHDGEVVTETSVINEYIEDVFPAQPLRPADPFWRAQMRIWTKYVDEYVCPALTVIGANFATPFAQKIDKAEMAEILSRIPLDGPRRKWATVSSTGYSEEEVADARRRLKTALEKAETALSEHEWLAAPTYSLADVNAYSMLSGAERVLNLTPETSPQVVGWLRRMEERPGVKKALSYPGRMRPPPTQAA